jgi:hypothetical protein
VVGHEHDGAGEVVEDLGPHGATAQVVVRHRAEDEAQEPLAHRPGVAAAGPGDVHLGVLARQLTAAGPQLGALRAQLRAAVLELLGTPGGQLRAALLELGRALLDLRGARLAVLDRAVESAVSHALTYSPGDDGFRLPAYCL